VSAVSEPTAQQVILATVLVFGVATACQLIAPRLRIPALVLLLPAGFLLGIIAPDDMPGAVLGPIFPTAVDFVVAIILFNGGAGLTAITLQGKERNVVRRLVWIGAPVTAVLAAIGAHFIIGMPWPIAAVLGSTLVVSGPTVVNGILDVARPNARVRRVLVWEGTLLDPLGALAAVVVFQIVKASDATSIPDGIAMFFGGILVATVAAAIGTALFVIGGRLARGSASLATQVVLASVLVTVGLANLVAQDSGLLAAVLMGMAAPRVAKRLGTSLDHGSAFFDTIVTIGIGVLFVSISALVPLASVQAIWIPAVILAVLLILVQRPLVSAICSFGGGLTFKERAYIGLIDPRGIVAAVTASGVGTVLVAAKMPGAQDLLPAAFIIIAVTVTFYGVMATPFAKVLGLRVAPTDAVDETASEATPSSS
jgi:NhaP-type Na+/H+ or K+/H+ antiporter